MTPEMLQTYSIPIGVGLAIVIMVAVGPLRSALSGSFEQGRKSGQDARRALAGAAVQPKNTTRLTPPAPRSFGRR